jgi:hypothetical protein
LQIETREDFGFGPTGNTARRPDEPSIIAKYCSEKGVINVCSTLPVCKKTVDWDLRAGQGNIDDQNLIGLITI